MKLFLQYLLLILLTPSLYSHEIHWPLNVNSHISGTFAEFRRPGVLHMGIDIKTYGMNGFKVLSPFQGYVHYLRYSGSGYGLSVDILAPKSGLQARYAHLSNLKGELPELERFKEAAILLNDGNPVNLKLPQGMFPTKEAMVIASTGESGSGISHLHFELMNNQGYLNPLVFGKYAKNDYHPPIIRKIFIEDSSGQENVYEAIKKSPEKYVLPVSPAAAGKIRIKVEGYDTITSKNKNNLFSLKLLINDKEIYSRKFDEISWQDYNKEKYLIFDGNRSSLIPPVYVYNLFSQGGFSLDTSAFHNITQVNVKIDLADASDNHSYMEFTLNLESAVKNNTNSMRKYFISPDRKLSLNFNRSVIYGNPDVLIQKLDALPEELKRSGLLVKTNSIYKISTSNFTWYHPARGTITLSLGLGESLYLYNTETSQWNSLPSKTNGNSHIFEFTRPGILAVMKDELPPVIHNPYLMTRYIDLEPNSKMIQKVYAVSDTGSGINGYFEVFMEEESYPWFYDYDRKSLIIDIPRSIRKYRKVVPIRIRATDKAGNKSDWFVDIINLEN